MWPILHFFVQDTRVCSSQADDWVPTTNEHASGVPVCPVGTIQYSPLCSRCFPTTWTHLTAATLPCSPSSSCQPLSIPLTTISCGSDSQGRSESERYSRWSRISPVVLSQLIWTDSLPHPATFIYLFLFNILFG